MALRVLSRLSSDFEIHAADRTENFMANFNGRIALITGASGGIGKATAIGLAAHGATVCLVGRRRAALEAVAAAARLDRRQVFILQADLTSDADIEELVKSAQQYFDHIDVLVHSAGIISLSRIDRASIRDFDCQFRTNVRAPYLLTQALLPMIKACQGQIVFINSRIVLNGNATANSGQYVATKHALKAVADSLREEINADGVRVLSLFPGRTATPMQASIHEIEAKLYRPDRLIQPDDVAAVVINALSLPKTVEVTEITMRPFIQPCRPQG